MISRKKKKGTPRTFWEHYHKIVDLCYDGNEELLEKINVFGSEEQQQRLFTVANIPQKYFKFDYNEIIETIALDIDNQTAVNSIKTYYKSLQKAADQGIGLYIHGPHGVAKTTITTLILKKAVNLYFRCFFWKSSDIIEFIRSGWKNENRRRFFDYVVNTVDFLVIDDIVRLFSEYKEAAAEKLYIDKIFIKRDDMNLSTIITSNVGLDAIQEQMGPALYSNFRERLIDVEVRGDDFRDSIGNQLLNKL